MVFKLFGFKGSLHGRRKEPKGNKDEVVCIGYKVNQEFLDSLPPPVLKSNPQEAGSSKLERLRKAPLPWDKDKPNGNIPQGVSPKIPPEHSQEGTPRLRNAQNINKKDVVKEKKLTPKPIAKDLFERTARSSGSEEATDDVVFKKLAPVVNNAEVAATSNTFSTHRDSDSDRKSTLIFLTENHDESTRDPDHDRHSNLYEEMEAFHKRASADSETKIDFRVSSESESKNNSGPRRGRRSSSDSDGKIDFVSSNRFASSGYNEVEEYSENPEMYSSQASSLFFGDSEPEPVKLRKTKKTAPARPSEATSETSA